MSEQDISPDVDAPRVDDGQGFDHGQLFDDGKAPGAMRTIGEVAKALDIRQHVLRYWEEQFPMLQPLKRSGGRRYYRTEDIRLLETIVRLVQHEGYTLRGARLAIEGGAMKVPMIAHPAAAVASAALSGKAFGSDTDFAPQLRAIRDRLAAALAIA